MMVNLMLGNSAGTDKKELPYAFNVEDALPNQLIVIPAGKYNIPEGSVSDLRKNGKYVGFTVENKFIIRPDQVTTLNLGKPKAELAVLQEDRTLSVNRELVFAGNPVVTYSMEPEGESKDQSLTVDVVDATDPTKVIVGRKNMEYG
jgi:hypothetical protein